MFAIPLRYFIQCRYSKFSRNILQLITLIKVAAGGAMLTGPGGASQAAGASVPYCTVYWYLGTRYGTCSYFFQLTCTVTNDA